MIFQRLVAGGSSTLPAARRRCRRLVDVAGGSSTAGRALPLVSLV
jgi:hypothetical protein